MKAGRFITFEGIDGAGKSSQIAAVVALLQASGVDVDQTREPGGTALGERLRELLLHEPMHLETEAMLMFAARREHLAARIEPALAAGRWVVCDRFSDATFAYQVGGRGLDRDKFDALEAWVHPGLQPDLTLVFDLDPAVAAARVASTGVDPDRFEREQRDFFVRVRTAYLERAARAAGRAGDQPDDPRRVFAAGRHRSRHGRLVVAFGTHHDQRHHHAERGAAQPCACVHQRSADGVRISVLQRCHGAHGRRQTRPSRASMSWAPGGPHPPEEYASG